MVIHPRLPPHAPRRANIHVIGNIESPRTPKRPSPPLAGAASGAHSCIKSVLARQSLILIAYQDLRSPTKCSTFSSVLLTCEFARCSPARAAFPLPNKCTINLRLPRNVRNSAKKATFVIPACNNTHQGNANACRIMSRPRGHVDNRLRGLWRTSLQRLGHLRRRATPLGHSIRRGLASSSTRCVT